MRVAERSASSACQLLSLRQYATPYGCSNSQNSSGGHCLRGAEPHCVEMPPSGLPLHTDVAIIGGGPCGLATAHALAKVLPTSTITLLEKAPTLTMPRGAGLGLAVNGLKALRAINPAALDAVVQRSTTSRMMESRSVQGAVLKSMPLDEMHKATLDKFGETNILLGWHELVAALYETLPDQVGVHTSMRFLNYEEDEAGVTLHLASSQDDSPVTMTANLVVAADGYFSKVRQQCLNDGPPDFGAAMVWRARVDAETAAKFGFPEGTTISYFGNNRVVLLYTAGKGHVVWTASCQEAALEEAGIDWREVTQVRRGASAEEMDFFQRMAAQGQEGKARLLRLFKDWHPELCQLFEATEPSLILEHGIYVRPSANLGPEWFGKGRVVLVGDAAHPMRPTGQGTNQALEDALLLGRYIQRDNGGLGLLEEFRRHRATRLKPIVRHVEVQGRSAYSKSGFTAAAAVAKAERSETSADTAAGKDAAAGNGASNGEGHGAGAAAEPAGPAVTEEGLLEDWDSYVYLGEEFSPLEAAVEKVLLPA